MSETTWSPEPWLATSWDCNPAVIGPGGTRDDLIAWCTVGGQQAKADARRIVACVNACVGVDTAELEGLEPGDVASALGLLP